MTTAVFEVVFVPRARNEVSKTKLHFNLSPAVGINLVLAPVRVHRYVNFGLDRVHRWFFMDASGSTFTKRLSFGSSFRSKLPEKFFEAIFLNILCQTLKKFALRAILLSTVGGAGFVCVARGTKFYKSETFPRVRVHRTNWKFMLEVSLLSAWKSR